MRTRGYSLFIVIFFVPLMLFSACGEDDGNAIPADPGENGVNLPSGGSATSPVGKYVGHFLVEGWQVDPQLASSFPVCLNEMVYIDGDLNLVVGDETELASETVSIPLSKSGETYAGQEVITEDDGAQVTVTVELAYNDTAERWQIELGQELDSDADGTPEATGQAIFRLEPRLDWTSLRAGTNGTFDSLNVVSRPSESVDARPYVMVGDGSEQVRERFQIDADGALTSNTGSRTWFYEGADGPVGLVNDDESGQCYEASFDSLAPDYSEMTVRSFARPEDNTEPDFEVWPRAETTRYYMYGGGTQQPDFQQTDVTFSAMAGSQVDRDTDGQDAGDGPFFYFGSDLASELTAQLTLLPIANGTATVTPPIESGEEPFEMSYGYMRVNGGGYLVMNRLEISGELGDRSVGFETFVFATDAQGKLTGDGLLQGYDFPLLDSSTSVNLEEWEAMDNEGLLMFGSGVDPDLFDFVTTSEN
jgi:hypothetical protein